MRICAVGHLALGLLLQVGCASLTLSPTATPKRLQAYNDNVAAQYVAANDFERQKNYEQARQIAPKNVRLLTDMGYFSYLRGDLSAAEQVLREAQQLKPKDPRVMNNLALVLASQGKMDECQALLEEMADPAQTYASLAYIYAKRGETNLAEAHYRKALAINPNLKSAAQAMAQLSKRAENEDFVPVTPPALGTGRLDSLVTHVEEEPVIQQAKAEIDAGSSRVITAAFEEPSFTDDAPGLLPENQDAAAQSNRRVKSSPVKPAVFDDRESADFEDDLPTINAEISEPNAPDDDWADN